MREFISILNIEWKRFLRPRNIILLSFFILIAFYFLVVGLLQYSDILKCKEEFKNVEQQKVAKYINYNHYGSQGFRILLVPSPISVFFHNSGKFFLMTANLNVAERLDFDVSLKGKGVLMEKSYSFADFAGFYLLFGSLWVLFYIYEAFRDREYLKFLSIKKGINHVSLSVFTARFIIINLVLLAILLLAILVVIICGFRLIGTDFLSLAAFYGYWLLVSFLMFGIGSLAACIDRLEVGIITIVLSWIFLVLLIPIILGNIVSAKARTIPSNYRNELDILTELWKFEQLAKEKNIKFSEETRTTKPLTDAVDGFINNQYKSMQRIIDDFGKITDEQVKGWQKMVMVVPTAFYHSLTSELSSKGYGSIADFYRCAKEMKHQFSMYYRYKKFQTKETKVENFIKGEENIYYARPKLPPYMLLEVMIYAMIAMVLFYLSLVLNSRMIYSIRESKCRPGEAKSLFINSKSCRILSPLEEGFADYLLNLMIANTREIKRSKYNYPGRVYLDDEEITTASGKIDTFYIPPVENIPLDIRVYDLLAYFNRISGKKGKAVKESINKTGIEGLLKKRFWHLEREEQIKVLLECGAIAEMGVYIIDDLGRQMPLAGLVSIKKKMEELAGRGAAVCLLTKSVVLDMNLMTNIYYSEIDGLWSGQVERINDVIENLKTLKEKPAQDQGTAAPGKDEK